MANTSLAYTRPTRPRWWLIILAMLGVMMVASLAGSASAGTTAKTPGELLVECIESVAKVRPGMTTADVLTVACRPAHINSTITLDVRREQWVYPDVAHTGRGDQYLYFEDDRVVAVQLATQR